MTVAYEVVLHLQVESTYVSVMNFSQKDAFDFTTIERDFAEIMFDRSGRHFVGSGVT